jgi:predicted dehydrogenase
MKELGIGIIGTGFMGMAHAFAYRAAKATFPDGPAARLVAVADASTAAAEAARDQFGFARATDKWQSLITDPAIDVISITTPNHLHKEMALAAIAAGKHVHCEKPLAPTLADAITMMEAAEAKGVMTQVGYNYIKNPLLKLAREIIGQGEIGRITGFRGIHAEDYMHDPNTPWGWRLDPTGGPGVIADLGSHIIGMARFLIGPIVELVADIETVVSSRPVKAGSTERRAVETDDAARIIARFDNGATGTLEASWVATGRKMQLDFEVIGEKGSLAFTQERFNELQLYRAGGDSRTAGYTRIEAGPQHAPYRNFCVAPGHQLGFNDLKTIEIGEWLAGIASGTSPGPDFREAVEIQKVVDAAIRSSQDRRWKTVG